MLYNIGYNISAKTVDYEAYNYDFSVRTYFVLEKADEIITLYGKTDFASIFAVSIFAVMDAIIKEYNANGMPTEGTLFNDYTAVMEFLNSTQTDKNGKTIGERYTLSGFEIS